MTTWAQRPVALVATLLIVLTTAAPVLAGQPPASQADVAQLMIDRGKHEKLDSQLTAMIQDVMTGRGSAESVARSAKLARGDSVAVSIGIDGDPATLAAELGNLGGTVANIGERTIEAFVPVTVLEALSARQDVALIRTITPPRGRVVSQGVAVHGAPNWHTNGFTGAGVKVGVIDVGFNGYQNLIGSELPSPVVRCYRTVGDPTSDLADCARLTDHGTAVTETLMDVAPAASLYIANPQTALDLQSTVDWMIAEGVTVINHSVGWIFEGPGDGTSVNPDGVLAAVDKAVAAGITWINAAGNEGMSNWSGGYLDSDDDGYIEFGPGDELNGVAAYAGMEIIVQMRWDDSWSAAAADLDMYLTDASGNIVAKGDMLQSARSGNIPFEKLRFIPAQTGTFDLAVRRLSGPEPEWIQLQVFSGERLEHATAGYSISNPGESRNAGLLAVGAASWQAANIIEDYSSQGPTRDGRIKPDLVGVDFADTATYGPNGFPGTSQSAPHVSGLAVLVKQRFPSYGAVAVANYLRGNAIPIGSTVPSSTCRSAMPNNTWGYGLAHLPEINLDGESGCPVIISAEPAKLFAGGENFTLTIDGANFVPSSIVRLNGEDRGTTFVDGTRLQTAVLDRDVASPGTIEVTVYNPAPGGGVSNTMVLSIEIPIAEDHDAFYRTWARTDYPVDQLLVRRTWMWGTGPATDAILEHYLDAPGGTRAVKYFDKSRMEITDPNAFDDGLWFVTNGLLAKELITGDVQVGDGTFEGRSPAKVNVAGDPDDSGSPTYSTFTRLLDEPPLPDGEPILQRLDHVGSVVSDEGLTGYGVTAAWYVAGTNHSVASPFWEFMNSSGLVYQGEEFIEDTLFENPFYATGLPITEAYWARVKVAGVEKDVLMQCFERRCLTYTPDNPEGWKVEAGNVGRHYYEWRYGRTP